MATTAVKASFCRDNEVHALAKLDTVPFAGFPEAPIPARSA